MRQLYRMFLLSDFYNDSVIPQLYFIALWLAMSSCSVLFFGELWRGLGFSSALSLYFIIGGYYKNERQQRMQEQMIMEKMRELQNDQSKQG